MRPAAAGADDDGAAGPAPPPHADVAVPPPELSPDGGSPDDAASPGALGPGGHHPARVGDTLKSGRYRVLGRLGCGHFSTVWLCFDAARRPLGAPRGAPAGAAVAVKIQKSAARYSEAAHDEIALLRAVHAEGAPAEGPVVALLDSFAHSGPNGRHVCLVFEAMGCSLLNLIKRFRYRGVPMPLVRTIAYNMLRGLRFLHEGAGIIHTDLKPENILLVPSGDEYCAIHSEAARFARYLCDVKARRRVNVAAVRADSASGGEDDAGRKLTKNQRKRRKANARRQKRGQDAGDAAPADKVDLLLCEEERPAVPRSSNEARPRPPLASSGSPGFVGSTLDAAGPARSADRLNAAHGSAGQPGATSASDDDALRWPAGQFVLEDLLDVDSMFRRADICIIDLGNACRSCTTSTGVIQTRQYRSPEVITGGRFGPSADIWSAACLVFELATGEFLFDPNSGEDYDRDEDHLGQMIELLGPIPRSVSSRGAYANELFNRHGELRHIRELSFWSIERVLYEKYKFRREEATEFGDFLRQMLMFEPGARSTAAVCLQHAFFAPMRQERR
jgi:serine/threonine-protein kinase SRPK3